MPFCPECGAQNAENTKFCPHCGTAQPDLPSTTAAPTTAAPPVQTAGAATTPASARKIVTALFSDLVGSTAMAEKLDPETVQTVMSRYFAKMSAILESHGGTVEKFIGDAIVGVFGVPVVHEDDALRAIRTALEMQDALGAMNQEFRTRWGFELHARIGVNTGEVMAGDVSSGQGFSTGDTMNVAARLEQNAAPGEVLVGEATYQLTRHAASYEDIEGLALKGKAETVPAWRLLSVQGDAQAISRRLDSVMVGRDEDLARLIETYERVVASGGCELVTLLGSAGIGKSRLAAELVRNLDERQVLQGRCLPYGDGITFWPLTEAVKKAAAIEDVDSADVAVEKIRSIVSDDDEADLVVGHLAEAVGLRQGVTSTHEIFWAARRFFEHMARSHPLVLLFDDLHWAAPTFLDLVQYLASWSKSSPILILCPTRPELLDDRADWGRGLPSASMISLPPLTRPDTASLIKGLLGEIQLPEEIVESIVEASGGNPLFVEEMIRMLVDDGLVERREGRWLAVGDVTDLSVPYSVQALIAARLDRLERAERITLQRGSVVGKVFWWGAVSELSPPEERPKLGAQLQTLVRRELLDPETSASFRGEDAFRFRNILTRDAAYDGLPKGARADLHHRFAGWLSERIREPGTGLEEILGYHLEKAVEYHRALGTSEVEIEHIAVEGASWLAEAGRRALDRSDIPAAVSLLGRAARLIPATDIARADLLLDLCDATIEAGDLEGAEELSQEVFDEATAQGAELQAARADVFRLRLQVYGDGSNATPERTYETIEVLKKHDDSHSLARAHQVNADLYWEQAEYALAEKELQEALEYARSAGARREETKVLGWLPFVLVWGPTHREEALTKCERVLAQGRGHLLVEAKCMSATAVLYAMGERFEEARAMAAASRKRLEELGMRLMIAWGTQLEGQIELLAGDARSAERAIREGFESLGELGDRSTQLGSAGLLCLALVEQGRGEEAWELTQWIEEHAPADDKTSQADCMLAQARILLLKGEAAAAEGPARAALETFEVGGELISHAEALMALAHALRDTGRPDEARARAERALRLYEQKGIDPWARRTRAFLEELAVA